MARNRTPVMWFEGGPLHGMQLDKTTVGRWQTYLEPHLRDGRVEPLRTVHGNARVVRRAAGDPVTFYRLDGDEKRVNGRFGRTYVFCTLLEQRARDAARAAEAEASDPAAVVQRAGEQIQAIRGALHREFPDVVRDPATDPSYPATVPRFVEPGV